MNLARRVRRGAPAVIVLAAALSGPALGVGAPPAVDAGGFNEPLLVGYNTFYPRTLTVEQGSSVKFVLKGFHTVVFPKRGTRPAALVIPGATLNPPTNDPAGQPYWWGGTTPVLGLNPVVPGPSGGTRVTGARTVSSGFSRAAPRASP